MLFCAYFSDLKSYFKWKMVQLRGYFFFLFCFENAKNLGRSDDAKLRKKEDGLSYTKL